MAFMYRNFIQFYPIYGPKFCFRWWRLALARFPQTFISQRRSTQACVVSPSCKQSEYLKPCTITISALGCGCATSAAGKVICSTIYWLNIPTLRALSWKGREHSKIKRHCGPVNSTLATAACTWQAICFPTIELSGLLKAQRFKGTNNKALLIERFSEKPK